MLLNCCEISSCQISSSIRFTSSKEILGSLLFMDYYCLLLGCRFQDFLDCLRNGWSTPTVYFHSAISASRRSHCANWAEGEQIECAMLTSIEALFPASNNFLSFKSQLRLLVHTRLLHFPSPPPPTIWEVLRFFVNAATTTNKHLNTTAFLSIGCISIFGQ